MTRLLDSFPSMWALTQAKNLKKKVVADMEITKLQTDLIASCVPKQGPFSINKVGILQMPEFLYYGVHRCKAGRRRSEQIRRSQLNQPFWLPLTEAAIPNKAEEG